MIRAFVSSTYVDLKEHRAYVIGRLTAAGIFVEQQRSASGIRAFRDSLKKNQHWVRGVVWHAGKRRFVLRPERGYA